MKIISEEDIDNLIKETIRRKKRWHRICLHEDPNDEIHSMVMCMMPNIESGFHRHKNNDSIITYTSLVNSLEIQVREDLKGKIDTIRLDNETRIISIKDTTARNVRNTTKDPVIYLEHRIGPYNKEQIYWEKD